MEHLALYRKWRPLLFSEVVEQKHVVETLKNSVKSGRVSHAIMFSGPRGTGKTTIARILARALNCLEPSDGEPCNRCEMCREAMEGRLLDIIEIDAASNNSVDNIRRIIEETSYTPAKARNKVYIIDEVHMLSTSAFNALLKTLEEPPEHVRFLMATTEMHKVPVTILSRCQRYEFRRISVTAISERIKDIAKAGEISIEDDAARLIARLSDGALRDAIGLLEQCIIRRSSNKITSDDVQRISGVSGPEFLSKIVEAVSTRSGAQLLKLLDIFFKGGGEAGRFVADLAVYYRNLLICMLIEEPGDMIEASDSAIKMMQKQAKSISRQEAGILIKELSAMENSLKWAANSRILVEATMIKLCGGNFNMENADILSKLEIVEAKLNVLLRTGVLSIEAIQQLPDAGIYTAAGARAAGATEAGGAGALIQDDANGAPLIDIIRIEPRAQPDTQPDIKPDAIRAELDTQPDIKPDAIRAELDAQPDIKPDAQLYAEPDAIRAELDAQPDIKPDAIRAELDAQPYAEPDAKPQGPKLQTGWDSVIKNLLGGSNRLLHLYLHDTKAYKTGDELYIVFKDSNIGLLKAIQKEELTKSLVNYLKETEGIGNTLKFVTESEFAKLFNPSTNKNKLEALSEIARLNGIPFKITN